MENLLQHQDPSLGIKEAFMNSLGCESDSEFAREFGYLQTLPAAVAEAVEAVADEHDDLQLLMQWRPNIESALQQAWAMTSAARTVQSHYTMSDISHLRYCSTLLSRAGGETRVDQQALNELSDKIQALYEDTLAAETIPADLRDLVLGQLDNIRVMLRHYALRGSVGLAEAFERAVGATVIRPEATSDANAESQGFVKRYKEVLSLIQLTISTGSSVLALPGAVAVAEILQS
ncbi:hypothetical protein [Nocardia altamirensis]|uniref:hypothetical protein n=1 Tax=Nocardia altamirensis TaxID=472158 RepID=UPI00114D09AD|nr:hypothetical protein [Nocardia altamirensis]